MRRRDLLALPHLAAASTSVSSRPNFVFILVDDLRFDELRCTGHPFAQTPHCDRLARAGANFRNAQDRARDRLQRSKSGRNET